MNWYDRHLLPYLIDFACGLPMVQSQRRKLVPQAQGRVLEIGIWWAWTRPCRCIAWPKSAAKRQASPSS